MKKQGVGNFSISGSIFYYSILTPGHFSMWVSILSDTGNLANHHMLTSLQETYTILTEKNTN